jgi:hypothetical protein
MQENHGASRDAASGGLTDTGPGLLLQSVIDAFPEPVFIKEALRALDYLVRKRPHSLAR